MRKKTGEQLSPEARFGEAFLLHGARSDGHRALGHLSEILDLVARFLEERADFEALRIWI